MLSRYTMMFAVATLLIAGAYGSAGAQTLEGTVRDIYAAFSNHDIDLYLSYLADDAVLEQIPAPPPANGKQEVRAVVEGFVQTFPDLQYTIQRVFTSGNIAVAECIFTGTQQGEFMGIPATGNQIQVMTLDVMEFEGGKEKRVTQYYDALSLMVQLGVMLASELPPLEPSFTLPDPEPTGLAPVEMAREIIEIWNTHDLTPWAKMFHPDGDFFYNVLGIPLNRDQFVALQELFFLAFSDVEGEFVRIVDLGDGWVVAEMVFQGTHDGPYFGIPATGRSFPLRVAILQRIDEEGLATHFHVYFDNLTMLTQMGVFPPPEPSTVSPASWGEIKAKFR